jgi:hypothetical protein
VSKATIQWGKISANALKNSVISKKLKAGTCVANNGFGVAYSA